MIIALSGKMGSGKSTAVEILKFMVRDLGVKKPVKLVKFAGPLYDMQEMIYRRIAEAYDRPDTFIKDRKLLQFLGTEWGRETISQNIWIDLWEAEVTKALQAGYVVLCDDCRFDNEAETVRGIGGVVVRVTSERAALMAASANGIPNHASELGLSNHLVDIEVANNSTLDDFDSALRPIFKKILLPITVQNRA